MTPSARLSLALTHANEFQRANITALVFERKLLDLGFYNVEFNPPAATIDGVRYPLNTRHTELA